MLFFLMLFTLGLGSATGLINGIITVLNDQFPTVSKGKITGGICILGFAIGLGYITPVRGTFSLKIYT